MAVIFGVDDMNEKEWYEIDRSKKENLPDKSDNGDIKNIYKKIMDIKKRNSPIHRKIVKTSGTWFDENQ